MEINLKGNIKMTPLAQMRAEMQEMVKELTKELTTEVKELRSKANAQEITIRQQADALEKQADALMKQGEDLKKERSERIADVEELRRVCVVFCYL